MSYRAMPQGYAPFFESRPAAPYVHATLILSSLPVIIYGAIHIITRWSPMFSLLLTLPAARRVAHTADTILVDMPLVATIDIIPLAALTPRRRFFAKGA